MDIFTALSDPTRRKIIEILAQRGPLPAGEIYAHFTTSAPAISQHLKVLREAQLVTIEKQAQQRIYRVNPSAIREIEAWVSRLTYFWNQRLDVLDEVLAAEKERIGMESNERINGMEGQNIQELNLTRIYAAPRELVFKAWTDPRLMAQWWGPHYFTNPVCELDARPGGVILIHMRGPDGVTYPMKGVFHEVVPPERLVFTAVALEDEQGNVQLETRTSVRFVDLGERTELQLHVEVLKATPAAAGALAGMEAGWSQSLEKLQTLLASS
ncbi:MAG TPA: metalloregulator ArsR/SmtB family transcription factor [Anaerolineaceae bacterium]|nr:metalloregulator ArsR/SmtB family transcription factor [Anaerolineaceae bacterium]